MKIEIEITGTLRVEEEETWIVVDLFGNDVKLGEFVFNPKHKSINVELSKDMGKILGINVTEYLDYMKLISDLGLEIPKSYKKHWKPKAGTFDNEIVANFSIFPNKELSEKAANLSKLDRLILLWQYENDCLFKPNWKNVNQPKHSVIYVEMYKE